MPVLVTGATGVVGRALIPRLVETGGQVRVYVRRDVPEYRALGVKIAIGEADHEGRLESALEQVHTIVHLIGGPVPEKGVTVEWLNLDTTEVALRAATNAEVQRFLFLSHVGADPSSDHPYLAAKGRAEEAIHSARLEYAILRCAPILAPGSALMTFLERGGSGDARLSPLAVEDCVDALVEADARGAAVQVERELGGQEIVTLDDLALPYGRASGILRRAARPPASLASLYARDFITAASRFD